MIRLEKFDNLDFDRLTNWIDSEESMIQFRVPIFQLSDNSQTTG